jgi:hypothetical protein
MVADLEGVVTHERGHTADLGDIYNHGDGHMKLTMGGSSFTCSKQIRSLGEGDIVGLKDLYTK